ncbi:MAG: protein kinase, partial [Planctomycetota bacterium]
MSAESGQVLSHYRLLEKIGQGAMGVVYRALDTRLQRQVAIKVLRPQKLPDRNDRQRFQNEARTAASLNHPNICTIHEVGEAGAGDASGSGDHLAEILPGMPFIVMELLEGEPLSARIQRDGALPLPYLLDMALQLAEGLREAHARGVTHRDLKPHNIVTTTTGRAKILDFGLAQPRRRSAPEREDPEEAETITLETDPASRIAGTIAYMSPEQTLGKELDQRSDIFSFGTILYEMAAGTRPFPGESITETVAKILEANPVPLSRLRPEIPPALVAVVERCLRKQAEERYQDAGELLESLRPVPGSDAGRAAGASVCNNTVAVLPFAFRGAESFAYLRDGMVNLLSTKLDGAGELRSVDANVILCCDILTDWEPEPAAGREVALRHNAGLFVLGSVVEIGGQLHLETALYDSQGEEDPLARAAAEGPAGEIFEMVDRLTAELLAERCGGPNARLTRIAATSTDSFPALKAYLEGEQEMRKMRRAPAVDAFRRAVQHDPRFALAWYRLGVAALWSQRPEDAWEAIRRALDHRDRLTRRDGRLLDAFDALLRGDMELAEHLYRNIVGSHPDDVEAWYQLSELLFHHGPMVGRPLHGSREEWERLLALDPRHLPALVHLGVIAGSENKVEVLEAHTRRVLELGPESDSALWMRALRGFVLQD